jgi:hypothetical protein
VRSGKGRSNARGPRPHGWRNRLPLAGKEEQDIEISSVTFEIGVLYESYGIENCCTECHRILSEGCWLIGIKIGTHQYVVAESDVTECCGRTMKPMKAFEDMGDAVEVCNEVLKQYQAEGIKNLQLYELEPIDRQYLN